MIFDKLFGFEGKIVLVMGGVIGIGWMVVEGLIVVGVWVLIVSCKVEVCLCVVEELNVIGYVGMVEGFGGDVGVEEGIVVLVVDVGNWIDWFDILMNNVGISWGMLFGEFLYEVWDWVLCFNLIGLFYLI